MNDCNFNLKSSGIIFLGKLLISWINPFIDKALFPYINSLQSMLLTWIVHIHFYSFYTSIVRDNFIPFLAFIKSFVGSCFPSTFIASSIVEILSVYNPTDKVFYVFVNLLDFN